MPERYTLFLNTSAILATVLTFVIPILLLIAVPLAYYVGVRQREHFKSPDSSVRVLGASLSIRLLASFLASSLIVLGLLFFAKTAFHTSAKRLVWDCSEPNLSTADCSFQPLTAGTYSLRATATAQPFKGVALLGPLTLTVTRNDGNRSTCVATPVTFSGSAGNITVSCYESLLAEHNYRLHAEASNKNANALGVQIDEPNVQHPSTSE
jgi:hypothetical protein